MRSSCCWSHSSKGTNDEAGILNNTHEYMIGNPFDKAFPLLIILMILKSNYMVLPKNLNGTFDLDCIVD